MIKILINNEEVVCNNNIKIDEKMLSTSSTILKNCYPLSWEQDKDYTSRFYFPEDYSKCKIIEEKEVSAQIIGECTQDGTPTPTNHIEITSKTGTIEEVISGKSYTFRLGDIELNKVGNYEDKIYQENGKWYLEKNTGKLIIDIDEVIFRDNQGIDYGVIDIPSNATNLNVEILSNFALWKETPEFELNIDRILKDQDKWVVGYNDTTLEHIKETLEDGYVIYPLYQPVKTEITDEILLEDLKQLGETLIFCGVVKNTGKISLNPREPHYVDLQVLDFKTLLSEGETLNYVITGKTITEAINQVISTISDYGFILGNLNIQNPDDIINAYSTLNKTAYDVFQYIADITQSRWTTRLVDENLVAIDFIDPTLEEEQAPILYTQEYFEDNDIIDMSFNYSTNDYRNKQIMTSEEVYGNIIQSETKVADGYTKTFMCDNKIGEITSIKVNNVNATFCTKVQEQLGVSADFVYQPGEMTFVSSNTLSASSVILISYYPIVRGREIVINSSEISRIANNTGRKGTISRYENRNDTTSSSELVKIGQSYIKYKGSAEITLKIVSKQDLFKKGDIVEFNAPIEELDTKYMVKDKVIDIYPTANEIFYTFEMSSNFNSEDAINYFDNQRAKNQGNLGEGETIARAIDLESTALLLFYDTEIEQVEVVNPTSLDFALDGVLI